MVLASFYKSFLEDHEAARQLLSTVLKRLKPKVNKSRDKK